MDVAIVGAGPYGLSIAAHLAALGVTFHIAGRPMHTWLTRMPQGMRLKSEGFASTLYDPDSSFSLASYCQLRGLPYADLGFPIPVETFASYGQEFQRRLVPEVDHRLVVSLDRTPSNFLLRLEDGDRIAAHRVIVAVGISHFQHVPGVLDGLPQELVSHSSEHHTFDDFRGREVTVIGGGSSAADVAAALVRAGVHTQIVARKPVFRFHAPPGRLPRPLIESMIESIRSPMSGLGPGWRSLLCTSAPLVFHKMPQRLRLEVTRRHLGPAAGWFTKEQLADRVPIHLGMRLDQAKVQDGQVHLQFVNADGTPWTVVTDHVIAATGYQVKLGRLSFLSPEFRSAIRTVEDTPILSSTFESSIPGLFFVGAASANSFGPLARFVCGARFTARRLSRLLANSAAHKFARSVSIPG